MGPSAALIEKIPYLTELGITVLELLPIHQFDPQEGNYWGYMTMNFFAPHHAYAVDDPAAEFREMVDAMHAAGIEVWLDVVYNHTCEGDRVRADVQPAGHRQRLVLHRRRGRLRTSTTPGAATPPRRPTLAMRALVLRSLRHWAQDMGVDGFRFDLASILARDADGASTRAPLRP